MVLLAHYSLLLSSRTMLRKMLKTIVRVNACTIQFEVSMLNNFIILTNLKSPEGKPKIDEDFRVSNS